MNDSSEQNEGLDEKELSKLRDEVLHWIEEHEKQQKVTKLKLHQKKSSSKKPNIAKRTKSNKIPPEEKITSRPVVQKSVKQKRSIFKGFVFGKSGMKKSSPKKAPPVSEKKESQAKQLKKKITPAKTTPTIKATSMLLPSSQTKKSKMLPSGERFKFIARFLKWTHRITLALSLLILAIIIISFILIYLLQQKNMVIYGITRFIPFPAFIVNGNVILYHEFLNDYLTAENILTARGESQQNIITKENIAKKLIEDEIIEEMLREYGVSIQPDRVQATMDNLIQEAGSREIFLASLRNNGFVGWSIEKYRDDVVIHLFKRQALLSTLRQLPSVQRQTLERSRKIYNELVNLDVTFDQAIQMYGEDLQLSTNGDLGYFSKSEVRQIFGPTVSALKIGEVSEPIQISGNYHILQAMEILSSIDETEEVMRLRHIVLLSVNEAQQLIEQRTNNARIIRLIR